MAVLGWVAVALVVLGGGWMVFDGLHGLITGDYVTPSSGKYAGQLGPWSGVVEAVGIEPRSTLMMALFVALGLVGLAGAGLVALADPSGPVVMATFAALSIWYLPWGTISSVVVLAILWAKWPLVA